MNYRELRARFPLDTITSFSDDDLYQTFQKIRAELDSAKPHSKLQGELQIECCYLQREIQIRESRKMRHANYVHTRHGGNSSYRSGGYGRPRHKR